jgi:SAM-dependent methyltransferase
MSRGRLAALADRLPWAAGAYRLLRALARDQGLNPLGWARAAAWFARDYRRFARSAGARSPTLRDLDPWLADRTSTTPLDPTYFFQNAWAARRIFALNPARHVDVGSSAMAMAIVAQQVPVTMVDIRPVVLALEGIEFRAGSALALPFPDASLESLSSLCVVEHIGLGRYGDPLDVDGTEKALAEFARVLRPGGSLLVSVPVDDACRVYFNAHRAFTRDYLERLFARFEIVEERYQYGPALYPEYDARKGFGTGLFHLRRVRA